MGRDVEFDVVAADKTAAGLDSAARRFKTTNDKINKEQQKSADLLGKGLLKHLEKVAPQLAGDLAGVFSKAGSTGGPLLVGGLVASLPLLGATISGAIIGGVGIGGVLGGVALAARDPRVAATGKLLGQNLLKGLEQDADVFVAPVLEGAARIETRFEQMRPKIRAIFQGSSGFLDPLLEGALDGVDGILAGVERLIDEGGPVIDAFGEGFGDLGRDIGEAMAIISGGSEDSAEAIRFLFAVIGESLLISARFVRGLTEIYGALDSVQDSINRVLPFLDVLDLSQDRIGGSGTFAGEGATRAAEGLNTERAAAAEVTFSLEQAEAAVSAVYQANLNLYSSTTSVADAMADATEKIKENGRTLSLSSEKGRENRDALASVAGAIQRQYDAYVKVNGQSPASAALAQNLSDKFVTLAQKAGLGADKARELARELLNIPTKRDTKINTDTKQALADINGVKQRMGEVRSKTITVTVKVNASQLAKVNNQLDRAGGGAGTFSANSYWSSVDANSGVSRTGGPPTVEVASDVNVYLDGTPFYAMTAQAAQRATKRQQWRNKVGTR